MAFEGQGFLGFSVDGKPDRLCLGLKISFEKRVFRQLYSIYKCGQNSEKLRKTKNVGIRSFGKHLQTHHEACKQLCLLQAQKYIIIRKNIRGANRG